MDKKVILGQSDFCEYRRKEDSYYVDKSLLIKDVIDNGDQTILLPRPRRFGKTLNISMLRYFFEESDDCKQDCFEDLLIWQQGEKYLKHFNKYPVVYLTFNDCKCDDWEECFEDIKEKIIDLFESFEDIVSKSNNSKKLERFYKIINETATENEYKKSLKILSELIFNATGKKIIILIDEYDTPIHSAFIEGYYDKCIKFMKKFLHGAFKDNTYLEKGVITGILQVAKANIFSELNNIGIYNIFKHKFSDKFGFSEDEVIKLLEDFNLSDNIGEVRHWYDSYVFGSTHIYNPWSVLSYSQSPEDGIISYWKSSSSNDLIRILIENASFNTKKKINKLIKGKTITEKVADETVLQNMLNKNYNEEDLWAMLLYSGYLIAIKTNRAENKKILSYDLRIPNLEVETVYEDMFAKIAETKIGSENLNIMLKALLNKNYKSFEEELQNVCLKTLSYHDTANEQEKLEAPEQVYHAFLLGIFINLNNEYIIDSNKESGVGRFDIILEPRDISKTAFIIELKRVTKKQTIEQAINEALKQIEDKKYDTQLIEKGFKNIEKVAMAFDGKDALVSNKIIEVVKNNA